MRFLLFNIAVIAALVYLAGGRELLSGRVPLISTVLHIGEMPPKSASKPEPHRVPLTEEHPAMPLPPPTAEDPPLAAPPPVGADSESNPEPLAVIEVSERPQPGAIDPERAVGREPEATAVSAEERRRALFDLSREMDLLAVQSAGPSREP